MANHLENMARRLEGDPFFLACPLKLYAKSVGLDEDTLAAGLKCSRESLISVQLCRAPTVDAESFAEDIERIATRFSVDVDALMEAVRLGQAIFHMSRRGSTSRTLIAARDDESPRGADLKRGDRP